MPAGRASESLPAATIAARRPTVAPRAGEAFAARAQATAQRPLMPRCALLCRTDDRASGLILINSRSLLSARWHSKPRPSGCPA
jgi:hypothetical protein